MPRSFIKLIMTWYLPNDGQFFWFPCCEIVVGLQPMAQPGGHFIGNRHTILLFV